MPVHSAQRRLRPWHRLRRGISVAAYEAAMGEPVPDRPFWDLLSATRAVGIADAWYDSWVDFRVPGLTLPLVEERLDALVARALALI